MNIMPIPVIIAPPHKRSGRITLIDVRMLLTLLVDSLNENNDRHQRENRLEYVYPEDANYFFEYVFSFYLKRKFPAIRIANLRGNLDVYKTFIDYTRGNIEFYITDYLSVHMGHHINQYAIYHILIIGSDLYLLEQRDDSIQY